MTTRAEALWTRAASLVLGTVITAAVMGALYGSTARLSQEVHAVLAAPPRPALAQARRSDHRTRAERRKAAPVPGAGSRRPPAGGVGAP